MKFKHIHFIINPASGKEEPVLWHINKVMNEAGIDWDLSITKKGVDAGRLAKKLVDKTDLIAVYGGDGCVTQVASALFNTGQPMAIIPGGTANVMAKELNVPLDVVEALTLIAQVKHHIIKIDMGLANGKPFILRVNLGIMADMITTADRELKNSLGQLAYGVTAIKTVAQAQPVNYQLTIDGEAITTAGVSLTVTNSGNVGIGDFALQPGISINDGLLDVIVMKEGTLTSVLKVAGSTLLQQETDALHHWKAKKVTIIMPHKQSYICDDTEAAAKKLEIQIVPGAISMLVPNKADQI